VQLLAIMVMLTRVNSSRTFHTSTVVMSSPRTRCGRTIRLTLRKHTELPAALALVVTMSAVFVLYPVQAMISLLFVDWVGGDVRMRKEAQSQPPW
jgi:hypothetical protein